MKHIKLFENFINEAKALPLDKLVKMIGDKPECQELAEFIYTNYDKVTGLEKSMRDEEMNFPSEIEDLVDHYGFDIIEFTDCYGMAAEQNENLSSAGLNENNSALGADVLKNADLFDKVVKDLLAHAKKNGNKYNLKVVTKKNLEEWLKVDAEDNEDFDYLEDLDFSIDGFFEYMDH